MCTGDRVATEIRRTVIIRGVELRIDHRTGEGPPLVLCNGIGANLELLDPVVDALHDQPGRPIPTVRFDLPGTGGSPSSRRLRRMPGLARLVHDLIRVLGYDQADVLGISWGGALAQEFAYRNRRLCRRVVLCATSMGMIMVPGRLPVLLTLASPARYFHPSRTADTGRRLYGGGFGDNPDVVARFAAATRAPDPRGYYWQILAVAGWTSAYYLPLLRQPVLLIAGDDDPIVPLANVRLMTALLRNSTSHIVIGGGHLALLTHRAELTPIIHRFLTEGEPSC
jgi:poly(3-hydroxyalkanoate) depolymerase